MMTPDINGKLWHRGTKIGAISSCITFLVFGLTMTQDPDGPLAWLSNLGPIMILMPMAAASHAYAWGQRDQSNGTEEQSSN